MGLGPLGREASPAESASKLEIWIFSLLVDMRMPTIAQDSYHSAPFIWIDLFAP